MNIPLPKPGRDKAGMAVIVVISILAIILIFVAGNLRTLHLLRNDLKLIEKQQTNRLARVPLITNSPAAAMPNTTPK
jgi:hypothetical protein